MSTTAIEHPTEVRTARPPRAGDVLSLSLDLLDDNPFQPRSDMDPCKLEELAASIAQTGLIQPIAVRPDGPGRYQIVAGHRRVAAFRKLRIEAKSDTAKREFELIRAHVVAAMSDSQMAVAAYVENVQRDNLNPLDEAAALGRIRELGGQLSATDVATVTGQPERRVRRLLRLSEAPQAVKDCVASGLLVEVKEGGPITARTAPVGLLVCARIRPPPRTPLHAKACDRRRANDNGHAPRPDRWLGGPAHPELRRRHHQRTS